jgi:hypothetical protein
MTKPKNDETKDAFLHRFMADDSSRKEYPNESERFERAAAIWDNRAVLGEAANALGYNAERDGAELFTARHIQPGVVNYPEMKNPATGAQGIALLIEKPVLDAMRATMKGVPVINWAHDMSGGAAKWIADGKAVGVVIGSRWEGEDAWDHTDFMLWEKEAKANARGGFRVSNAWKDDDIDWTPGIHNGVRYDARLKAGHYTHLAIVPNPRYEGAVIFANAQGGLNAMMKLFGFGKPEAVELAKDASLEVSGKKYALAEVVNALTAHEAEKAKVTSTAKEGVLGEKDTVEVGGKKYNLAEVANALAAAEKAKAAAPAPEPKPEPTPAAKPIHETPEFQNAVAAQVAAALEKAKGDGFFNAVDAIVKKRGQGDEKTAPANLRTQRDRIAAGAKRFGGKPAVAAE